MTTSETDSLPKPYDDRLPGGGTGAIMVPLIIGAAIIIGAYILWDINARRARASELAKVEEEIRLDLIQAYRFLVQANPAEALQITQSVDERAKQFGKAVRHDSDYAELHAARLLLEANAEFMILCEAGAAMAEEKFTRAIGLMIHASGEMWEFGMMSRARARLEQDKYHEALADLDVLLAGNPNYGAAYYWRALLKYETGDQAGGQADEQRARDLGSWPPRRNFMQNTCGDPLNPVL